jgi:hypothetical protein
MSKKDKLILAAFVVCTLIEFWLFARITYVHRGRVHDWTAPDSWHILNFVLAAFIVVAMVTVLRTGRWWQRLLAPLLCVIPTLCIYDLCRWSMTQLSN